jgi:Lar family restriction alleviation protein
MKQNLSGLRQCPFCGSRSVSVEWYEYEAFMAQCQDCGASTGIKRTGRAAKGAWNRRAFLKEEALPITGKISLSCPTCGTQIKGELHPKYQSIEEADD